MLVVEEKAAQGNTGSPIEDEKTPNEKSADLEAAPAIQDDDEALQHLERLRKQYGVITTSVFDYRRKPNWSPLF